MVPSHVAVVGGGLAGTAAAQALRRCGVPLVTLFDRSKLGGRLGASGSQNTGCIYVAGKHPRFQEQLQAWESEGLVARWRCNEREGAIMHVNGQANDGEFRVSAVHAGVVAVEGKDSKSLPRWYVGTPSMSSLCKIQVASDLQVHESIVVESLLHQGGTTMPQWYVETSNGSLAADAVVLAVEPSEAFRLVPHLRERALAASAEIGGSETSGLRDAVECSLGATASRYAASLQVSFPSRQEETQWEMLAVETGSCITRVVNDTARYRRMQYPTRHLEPASGRESWVVQSDDNWASERMRTGAPALEVGQELAEEMSRVAAGLGAAAMTIGASASFPISGACPTAIEVITAVPWTYSRAKLRLPTSNIFDAMCGIGACGDWCGTGRAESAWLGGTLLAEELVSTWRR